MALVEPLGPLFYLEPRKRGNLKFIKLWQSIGLNYTEFYLPNFRLGKEYCADNCENIGEKFTHDGLQAA